MTALAVRPKAGTGKAPARMVGAQGAKPIVPAPAPPRPRRVALTPMRKQAAGSMRRLAQHIQRDHPELTVHQHLQDAARTLESGNEEAAQRHLRAAVFALTPQSLHRNGVHDDDGHISARQAVHGVHRHLLLVKDIQDVAARNQARLSRFATGDDTSSPPLPAYGGDPGALAQKPVARQPGGDRALNAPDRTNSGGSDPAVADPVGRQPKGSKQFSYGWDDLAVVVDLAARNGVHIPGTDYNWRHTYIPLTEAAARSHGHGKIPKGWSPSSGGDGKARAVVKAAPKASGKAGPAAKPAGDVSKQVHDEMTARRKAAGEANARADIARIRQSAEPPKPTGPSPIERAESAMAQKGGLRHPGSARHVVTAQKEANAGRYGNAITHLEKADSLEAHEGVGPSGDSRKKITATIASLKSRQAAAARYEVRNQNRQAAPKLKPAPAKMKPGSGKQLTLISERMGGGDRTSGEMKAGDMLEGHQAIAQAPPGVVGNDTHQTVNGHSVKGAFSDPWWMAKPGGGFAVSQRWRSKAQDSYDYRNGKSTTTHVPAQDKRVLTPVSPDLVKQYMSQAAAKAARTNSMWAGGARRLQLSWDGLASVIELAAGPALTKPEAHYRPGGTPGHRCGDCSMYRPGPDGAHCTLVKGGIDAGHVCDHFDRRTVQAAYGWDDLATVVGLATTATVQGPVTGFGQQSGRAYQFGEAFRTWDDLAAVIELSAETGRLAATPNPLGKKGLWGVADMELPPYVQNIAHALLRTGRAKTRSQAIAMARAATERWKAGGGHVRPEVRSAAAASDAQWQAKRARAHAQ